MFDEALPRGFKTWVPEVVRADNLRTTYAILSLVGSEPRHYTVGRITDDPILVYRVGRASLQRRLEYIAASLGNYLTELVLEGPIIRIPAAVWEDIDSIDRILGILLKYLKEHKTRRMRINLRAGRVLLSGFQTARATADRDIYLDDSGQRFSYVLESKSDELPVFSYNDYSGLRVPSRKQECVFTKPRKFSNKITQKALTWEFPCKLGQVARFSNPGLRDKFFAAMRRNTRK